MSSLVVRKGIKMLDGALYTKNQTKFVCVCLQILEIDMNYKLSIKK